MTATTERCPGCHGSGIEMSGVTYAGMSEYVGCHECGPECPDDCGCRASDATERPESIAPRHPGATQSPDGSQGATEGLRGPEGATGPDISEAFTEHLGALAIHHRKLEHGEHILGLGITCPCLPVIALSAVPHLETAPLPDASDVRPSPPARDAVTLGYDEASRVPVLLAEKAALMGDADRLECEVARLHELVGELRGAAAALKAENARLTEEATVSAALLETEIAKRESAEMRANRATADLDALEAEDRRQDVQAKHWREVLRIRRELDGIRQEMNDATEIIAEALGYRPSGLPLDGWPHLSTTGDHTPTSLAAEAAGVLAKASRLEGERDRARGTAATLEAENARLRADLDALESEYQCHANALLALLAEGGE